jgi:ribonucleoside-diphosphate reductase alpha chain
MLAVVQSHVEMARELWISAANELSSDAYNAWLLASTGGNTHGFRNSQATLLAPTGTIGMVMDADTTGVEPEYDLVTYKTLASGGIARRVSGSVREALAKLGREESAVQRAVKAIEETGRIGEALDIDAKDRAVLATAAGEWPLAPEAHVRMMAAVQPFLSGGISKTVNLPKTATVEDVSAVYKLAWEQGVKCVALYRDGCKRSQPLNGGVKAKPEPKPASAQPQRRSLPDDRATASAHKLSLGGHDLYMHVGYFDDGMPGELFVRMAKAGTIESCLLDALCQAVSVGLQYGVPLDKYLDKWIGTRFEPSGFTGAEDIRSATSPLDLIAKKLRKLPERADYAKALAKFGTGEPFIVEKQAQQAMHDLSPCCGATYKTTGSCKTCSACGATSGGCG